MCECLCVHVGKESEREGRNQRVGEAGGGQRKMRAVFLLGLD